MSKNTILQGKKQDMRIILSIILSFLIYSCANQAGCAVDGIETGVQLQQQAQKTGFPYCNTLKKALEKDEKALMQLVRFAYKTDDYSAVDHGIVFSELSVKLGDDFMSRFVQKQNREQRLLIAKMFDTCMEYRDPQIILEKELPKTYEILMDFDAK